MGRNRRLADVPMPGPEQPFLTRLEACRLARIGTSTFDKAVADKRIKVRWNGIRIIVERVEIERFVKSLPTERPQGI
jgi:hypothetical protein